MKKTGVVLVAVIAIALLGLPAVFGLLTEWQVRARVESLGDEAAVGARVVSFDRGWFNSTARINLDLNDRHRARLGALGAALPRPTTVSVELAHGPVWIDGDANFGVSRMVARLDAATPGYAELLERLGIPYVFEFRGRTGFDGRLAFDADVPPLMVAAEDTTLASSGAVLEGTFAGRVLHYDGRVESLEFANTTGTFTLERVTATGHNELRANVPLGPAEVAIARVKLVDAILGATVFEAADVHISSDFALDANGTLVNGTQAFSAASLDAPPGTAAVRDAHVTIAYANLDPDALEAYARALERNTSSGSIDPSRLLADVTPAVERLLAAEPRLEVDPVRFAYNDAPFDGRLAVTARGDALPPAGALDLRDPSLWTTILEVTATANVGKTLARDIAARVMSMQVAASDPALPPEQVRYMAEAQAGLVFLALTAQGLIVDNGETYSTELSLLDRTLSVNGTRLPLQLP